MLSLFKNVTNINPGIGSFLTTKNAAAFSAAKLDYVITGNAVNDPYNKQPEDSFAACGLLLKKGGRAIHMLGYGGDPKIQFDDPDLCKNAGQKHLYNIPQGPYTPNSWTGTQVMVLEQVREIKNTIPAKNTAAAFQRDGRIQESPSQQIGGQPHK